MIAPYIEEIFNYKGFTCAVLFYPYGHRCGYVCLPSNNKFYGMSHEDIDIKCHGGLTYGDNHLPGQSDENVWWIGFDCAHYNDKPDFAKAKEIFGSDEKLLKLIINNLKITEELYLFGTIKTLEYCVNECKHIVEQIVE